MARILFLFDGAAGSRSAAPAAKGHNLRWQRAYPRRARFIPMRAPRHIHRLQAGPLHRRAVLEHRVFSPAFEQRDIAGQPLAHRAQSAPAFSARRGARAPAARRLRWPPGRSALAQIGQGIENRQNIRHQGVSYNNWWVGYVRITSKRGPLVRHVGNPAGGASGVTAVHCTGTVARATLGRGPHASSVRPARRGSSW